MGPGLVPVLSISIPANTLDKKICYYFYGIKNERVG